MSQTETILLVVLGFALASLVALFVARMVWGLGLRIGARRMRKQVPFTVQSLQTERDRLRADYAMLGQRLGGKLETLKLRSAEQMAEVSRLRNRIEANIGTIAARDAEILSKDAEIAKRDAEIAALGEAIVALEAKVAAAGDSTVELRAEIAARDAEAAVRDAEVAGLKLAAAARGMEYLEPAPASTAPTGLPTTLSPEERLKARIDQIANMSRTIGNEQIESEAARPAEPDSPDFQKDLERLDAEWSRRIEEIEQPQQSAMPSAVANVISLANRIRALKRDISK